MNTKIGKVGRPPLPEKRKTAVRGIRLCDEHWQMYKSLGGIDWLRKTIESQAKKSGFNHKENVISAVTKMNLLKLQTDGKKSTELKTAAVNATSAFKAAVGTFSDAQYERVFSMADAAAKKIYSKTKSNPKTSKTKK